MLFVTYTLSFLVVAGLVMLVRAMISAPYATEDKNGFYTNTRSESEAASSAGESLWGAVEVGFFHR